MPSRPQRERVSVIAIHWRDGRLEPVRYRKENGDKAQIDRVVEASASGAAMMGYGGTRFTCQITNPHTRVRRLIYLFYEDGQWYIVEP